MKKLICLLVGHDWYEHTSTRGKGTTPFCVCFRCGKSGWLL